MKTLLATFVLASTALTASAQQYAANDYRVCPQPQTQQGLIVVENVCGKITRPDFTSRQITSLAALQSAQSERDAFKQQVADYGVCVNEFINSYRRPGADASSSAPDEAACAHAWAEDQVTQSVMEFGRSCIDFANHSITDPDIEPWDGACYPDVGGNGHG